jgi:site-specific DNA-methyltransferase (adenine-specific)
VQPNEEDVKRKVTLKLLKDLSPDNCNANRGTDRGRSMLGSSLKKYGAGRSILIDKHGTIIAGNKTVETAKKAGLKNLLVVQTDGTKIIAVQRTDLDMRTDKRARELAIADNRVAELDLDWNDEVLRELDVDLSQFWNDAELRKLIGQEFEEAPEPQMDRAAELQQKWGTARGQIWEIGKHRVMCGDSTSLGDITLLMGTDRAQCMWTDPPYGVSYVGKTKNKLTIQNDGAAGLEQFLLKAFSSANAQALADGAAVYVAHPAGVLQRDFTEAFVSSG